MYKKVEAGSFILRFVVGLVFFLHGLDKFQSGLDNIAGWFSSIGLPGFMAYVVASLELVGGFLLIIGVGTRVFAWLFALLMAGAIVKVKLAAGFMGNGQMPGYEYDVVLLAANIYLGLNGSSLLSIGQMIAGKSESPSSVTK